MTPHGVTRTRILSLCEDKAFALRVELGLIPPGEQLARAVDKLNARRPEAGAAAEAVGQGQ